LKILSSNNSEYPAEIPIAPSAQGGHAIVNPIVPAITPNPVQPFA